MKGLESLSVGEWTMLAGLCRMYAEDLRRTKRGGDGDSMVEKLASYYDDMQRKCGNNANVVLKEAAK